MEWEIPRVSPSGWPAPAQTALAAFWQARIARQREIDASISAKADFEYLYDKPFADSGKTRVAGPFAVESLSPHRTLAVDWNDELIDLYEAAEGIRESLDDITWSRAKEVVEGLRNCGPETSAEAIMWMLNMLWRRWGDRAHEELFPTLGGTFAGDVLSGMRAHYARTLERRRLHFARHGVKKKDWLE